MTLTDIALPQYTVASALLGLGVVGACMLALWALSVRLRNVAIVDVFWGAAFVVLGWTIVLAEGRVSPRGALVLGLLSVWGLRLSAHLYLRGRGQPEDRRYAAMRAGRGAAFWWQSLYVIFGLQALLFFVISAPIQLVLMAEPSRLGPLDGLGALLALIGVAIESIADHQLSRFKRRADSRGRVLRTGLFRYSRHPNYFGDFCVFWGLWLVALGVPGGVWSVPGPLLLSFLLLRVSGVVMLERDIAERRPEYRRYVASTPAFFPWFPRDP